MKAWSSAMVILTPWLIGGCGNWPYAGGCGDGDPAPYTEIQGDASQLDVAAFDGSEGSVSPPSECSEEDREAWRVQVVTGVSIDVIPGTRATTTQETFFESVRDELRLDDLVFGGAVRGCAERFQLLTDDWNNVETIAQVVIDRAEQVVVKAEVTIVVTGIALGCSD